MMKNEADAALSGQGQVTGEGKERTYLTKEGDTLEALAAFFYGSEGARERIIEENPNLVGQSGALMPGMRLNMSLDAEKGDAV